MAEIKYFPGCEPPYDMEAFLDPNLSLNVWTPRNSLVISAVSDFLRTNEVLRELGFFRLNLPEEEGDFMDRSIFEDGFINPVAGLPRRTIRVEGEDIKSLGLSRLQVVSFVPIDESTAVLMSTGFLRNVGGRWFFSPQGDDFSRLSRWVAVLPKVLSQHQIWEAHAASVVS
jgi:hypothetical protein